MDHNITNKMQRKIHQENEESSRYIDIGQKSTTYTTDNSIKTSKYTLITFLPVATLEQFRRGGNLYFLFIGLLMTVGYYGSYFKSAVSPWSTLLPLAMVVGVSMVQEGVADIARHNSDDKTNCHPCLVLNRSEGSNGESLMEGKAVDVTLQYNETSSNSVEETKMVSVAFESTKRAGIIAGNIVLIRNREMVPADVILVASSSENGSAYIETSSIDGETNLKLRTSPFNSISIGGGASHRASDKETLEQAISRITRISSLGYPNGASAIDNPNNPGSFELRDDSTPRTLSARDILVDSMRNIFKKEESIASVKTSNVDNEYVSTIISEGPNPSVNTYVGQIILPPLYTSGASTRAALGAENILLRGAVLRNTEWCIGVVVFAGRDTKLVRNSVAVPSKFSVLDRLVNKTVACIIFVNLVTVMVLAGLAIATNQQYFDQLWYLGLQSTSDNNLKWPYLPSLPTPDWANETSNYGQLMFLFVTLLSNFVPVSLYVTMEMITFFFIYLINKDAEMYHQESDTPALARSTNVTDLGRIDYIFSDKTGTLTENIMRFKRCSVDGLVFGAPVSTGDNTQDEQKPFHPLRQLLIGGTNFKNEKEESFSVADGLQSFNETNSNAHSYYNLTFNAEMFLRVLSICHTVVVEKDHDHCNEPAKDSIADKSWNNETKEGETVRPKGDDGAPMGFTYQAESPDEGALVSAASLVYGYQLVNRDSRGIRLNRFAPSVFDQKSVVSGLKSKKITPKQLACDNQKVEKKSMSSASHDEVWTILAVNKFDSDRKRMSILVRSPSDMGSIPILFCKGADSAMLGQGVCEGSEYLNEGDESNIPILHQTTNEDIEIEKRSSKKLSHKESDWEFTSLIGLQDHLGDFASEGLRTLVLGMRVLSEDDCSTWLNRYEFASTSICNRDDLLKQAAIDIECGLHIVGATAIEDKLQDNVPDTIANLAKAGIKLWVLTGDKRETAIEIGYSTKVLMPHMQLIQIVDGPNDVVKKATAKEFMRLVKHGKLPHYQQKQLNVTSNKISDLLPMCKSRKEDPIIRRKKVRDMAENILKAEKEDDGNPETPRVFTRAASARKTIEEHPEMFSDLENRNMSIASMTAMGLPHTNLPVEEDTLSIESFSPRDANVNDMFNKKKRTAFERLFAVDRDVRHGRLQKHVNTDTNIDIPSDNISKALIIEGAALLHLLGNPELEEMVFSLASSCEAVIACRVSPKQKALLVKMVRNYVTPEPVTLAIGDGANDVGMIQEAHVGVGISGKEGQQAVNSSDFAIAQFRYLENLLLVHGRWNFMRMTKVVLYSFYKNAVLVGLLATFQSRVLYSGTPLFNQWLTAMVNFVAGIPILLIGFFDRDVEKDHVRSSPDLYASGPDNEHMSRRMMLRWTAITVVHIIVIYVLSLHILTDPGRVTSAFSGLMSGRDPNFPGEGEMDFVTFGTIIFSILIVTLGYKVLFESNSIITDDLLFKRGKKSNTIEKWYDRFGWTWFGLIVLSYGFWMFACYMYAYVARFSFPKDMFNDVASHTFNRASIAWLVFFLIPVATCVCDVTAKLFASMYFPSQTQIHMEIASRGETI